MLIPLDNKTVFPKYNLPKKIHNLIIREIIRYISSFFVHLLHPKNGTWEYLTYLNINVFQIITMIFLKLSSTFRMKYKENMNVYLFIHSLIHIPIYIYLFTHTVSFFKRVCRCLTIIYTRKNLPKKVLFPLLLNKRLWTLILSIEKWLSSLIESLPPSRPWRTQVA